MNFIKAFVWIFSIGIFLSFVLTSLLFGAAAVWTVLTFSPIITILMLLGFSVCIVTGIVFLIFKV